VDGKSFNVLGDGLLAGAARKTDGYLLDPWEVSRVGVKSIRVFCKAVPLQSVRESNVGSWDLYIFGYAKMSSRWISNHGLAGSLPTAETSSGIATDKLYGDDAKQFRIAVSKSKLFRIVCFEMQCEIV
jgi:hypothetical protein